MVFTDYKIEAAREASYIANAVMNLADMISSGL